jgi:hypothetical protein
LPKGSAGPAPARGTSGSGPPPACVNELDIDSSWLPVEALAASGPRDPGPSHATRGGLAEPNVQAGRIQEGNHPRDRGERMQTSAGVGLPTGRCPVPAPG